MERQCDGIQWIYQIGATGSIALNKCVIKFDPCFMANSP